MVGGFPFKKKRVTSIEVEVKQSVAAVELEQALLPLVDSLYELLGELL